MDKGPDQDTRDDPDGLVEAIAENDSDDLYARRSKPPKRRFAARLTNHPTILPTTSISNL